jgi:5,6,7,8-tetrahydromethanopterin hydro-lyase
VTDMLDGRIGEAWAGDAPNGCHVNVVLARRGSATAAAAVTALANPRPGHTPFLVCLGPGTVVRPATIFVNKTTLDSDGIARLTWGAGQLGVGQGVLDAVADGLIDATGDLLVLVAVWIDPEAGDETAVRLASRAATRKALGVCIEGRDPRAAAALVERRDSLKNPFYGGE